MALLGLIFCFVSIVLASLPLTSGWRWVIWAVLLLSVAWRLRLDGGHAPHFCTAITCGKERHITLRLRNGEEVVGAVCTDTLVSPWLIILNVRSDSGGGRSLLLLPDSLDRDEFRRLRVWLRNA